MAVSEDVRKAVITVVLVINLKYEWGGGCSAIVLWKHLVYEKK